jgi:hypothetical protein
MSRSAPDSPNANDVRRGENKSGSRSIIVSVITRNARLHQRKNESDQVARRRKAQM